MQKQFVSTEEDHARELQYQSKATRDSHSSWRNGPGLESGIGAKKSKTLRGFKIQRQCLPYFCLSGSNNSLDETKNVFAGWETQRRHRLWPKYIKYQCIHKYQQKLGRGDAETHPLQVTQPYPQKYVATQGRRIPSDGYDHLVQWSSWIFATQQRKEKKEP